MEDVAISVKNVKKDFVLPHEKTTSIKSGIVNIFKHKDKSKETQHALKDVSFDIKRGEFFGILGRNGSGKSTLLKILAEIYQPTSGSVNVHGKLVPFIELGVGFNPELTGRENVYLNGALLGFSKKEIDDRYDDIVAFAELEEFMDQKLKNYSSGMQVRLAFSVATRAEADILLVDEVLAVGDADFQRKCYDYFKSLKKSGKTVVFVTHDMNAVEEYCDRAILINEGQVAFNDKASKTAKEYLKLFNTSETAISEEGQSRWGTGDIRFESISAKNVDENITITFDIKSVTGDYENFVLGFRIADSQGQLVAGGSTLTNLGGKKISLKKGESKKLSISIPEALFGGGTRAIGATIRLADGVTIADDWDAATQFKISKNTSFYPVIVPGELKEEN